MLWAGSGQRRRLWEPHLGDGLGSEQSSGSSLRDRCSVGAEDAPATAVCVYPKQPGLSLPCAPGWAREVQEGQHRARALPSIRGLTPSPGLGWGGQRKDLLLLQGERSEGQEVQEVQFRAASSPVLSINLSVSLPRSCTFTLRPLDARLAPALSALLNQGPEGLVVQRLFSIVSMCSFPLASSKAKDSSSAMPRMRKSQDFCWSFSRGLGLRAAVIAQQCGTRAPTTAGLKKDGAIKKGKRYFSSYRGSGGKSQKTFLFFV